MNDCVLLLEENSNFERDGICGWMAEADTALSLATMSRGTLGVEDENDLDTYSEAASPVLL